MGYVCWHTAFCVRMEGFEKPATTAFDEYSTGLRQSLKKMARRSTRQESLLKPALAFHAAPVAARLDSVWLALSGYEVSLFHSNLSVLS